MKSPKRLFPKKRGALHIEALLTESQPVDRFYGTSLAPTKIKLGSWYIFHRLTVIAILNSPINVPP
jgi:hypothetical protein